MQQQPQQATPPLALAAGAAAPTLATANAPSAEIPEMSVVTELLEKYATLTKRTLRKINSAKASVAKLEAVEISADTKVDLPSNAPMSSLPKQPTLWVPIGIENEESLLKI
jgi:hypothetical protein